MKKSTAQIIAGVGTASLIAMNTAFAGGAVDSTASQTASDAASSIQAGETLSQSSASAASANASQSTANESARTAASSAAELPQTSAARKQREKGFEAIENDELLIDTSSIADGDGMGSIQIQWQI